MSKYILISIAILFFSFNFSLNLTAQCNVEISAINDTVKLHRFNYEEICKPIILENRGFMLVSLETYSFSVNNGENCLFFINLYIAKENTTFAPRKIMMYFDNGETELLSSTNYSVLGGDTSDPIYKYQYDISIDLLEKLSQFTVKSITLMDTRLEKNISISPFRDVFMTQMRCVFKSARNI